MAFGSRDEAQNAATVAAHQHGSDLRVYNCDKCDLWHLSTNFGEDNNEY